MPQLAIFKMWAAEQKHCLPHSGNNNKVVVSDETIANLYAEEIGWAACRRDYKFPSEQQQRRCSSHWQERYSWSNIQLPGGFVNGAFKVSTARPWGEVGYTTRNHHLLYTT